MVTVFLLYDVQGQKRGGICFGALEKKLPGYWHPRFIRDMRKLFLELKEQGKTMVIASHSAEDIDILCDTVHEMDKGVLSSVR